MHCIPDVLHSRLAFWYDIAIQHSLGSRLVPFFIHDHRLGHISDIDIQSKVWFICPWVFDYVTHTEAGEDLG